MSRDRSPVSGGGRQELLITDKVALETAFRVLHEAGGRFSTLVADIARYAGYRIDDLADAANLPARRVRSCLQGRAVPTRTLRRVMTERLGFDPWHVAPVPNRPPRASHPPIHPPYRDAPPDEHSSADYREDEP